MFYVTYIKHVAEKLCGQLHNLPCFQIDLKAIYKKSAASYNLDLKYTIKVLSWYTLLARLQINELSTYTPDNVTEKM